MTKRLIHILALFVFLVSASGQQSAPPAQTAADAKAELELNKKAESLLIEVTRHLRGLKSKENQVVVRIAAGDLLWKTREATARVLYKEAADILRQALINEDDSQPEAIDHSGSLEQLRERLLQSLAQHDPMMARDLLRGDLRAIPLDGKEDTTVSDNNSLDTRLELSLATQMVDQNPKEAVRIARDALSDGYPYELVSLLPKLAEKEPKMANDLAVDIINKLRKADFGSSYEASNLALSMAHEVMSSGKTASGEEPPEKRTSLLDPQSSREFIQFLIEAALKKTSVPARSFLLMSLRSIIEDLERFAPAQASLLKERFSETEKMDTDTNPYSRFQRLSATNDTKAMLELAETAPREMRDSLYGRAASVAWEQGDKAKANEIITTKISDPLERSRLATGFQEQTVADLIEKQEFVQARQVIAQIRSNERRFQQLIGLAEVMVEKGNKKTTLEVLQEAQGLVGVKARNESELDAQFKIAGVFSELDPDRSFMILGSAIDQINELMAATALLSNFGPNFGPNRGIINDEFEVDSSSIPFGFSSLSPKNIRTLALVDFNRTKEVLDRFQRPETRIAAYLKMSGSILQPPSRDDCTCQERLKQLKSKTTDKVAP